MLAIITNSNPFPIAGALVDQRIEGVWLVLLMPAGTCGGRFKSAALEQICSKAESCMVLALLSGQHCEVARQLGSSRDTHSPACLPRRTAAVGQMASARATLITFGESLCVTTQDGWPLLYASQGIVQRQGCRLVN